MPHRIDRIIILVLIAGLVLQPMAPTTVSALTGGPAQSEFSSFEPVATTDMVDLFSGDFVYNIPLMDVGGYPVNISYHSGIGMDQEAGWTGLGWNINMGVINRRMCGMPDDYMGTEDAVTKEYNVLPNITWGVSLGFGVEIAGLGKKGGQKKGPLGLGISANLGLFHNNYKGLGFEFGISPSISATTKGNLKGTLGLGLGYNSQEGINLSPSASFSKKTTSDDNVTTTLSSSIGTSYSSRAGLKVLSLGVGVSVSEKANAKDKVNDDVSLYDNNGSASMPLGTQTYTPQVAMPMSNESWSMRVTVGGEVTGSVHMHGSISGYYSKQGLANSVQSVPAYGYVYSDRSHGDFALLDFNREKDLPFTDQIPNLPVTNFTRDGYSASGHGVSGAFVPHRGDVGIVHDQYQSSSSQGYSGGAEIGVPAIVHVGLNLTVNIGESTTRSWTSENGASSRFAFFTAGTDVLYEPYYFKNAGEKTIGEKAFQDAIAGTAASRLRLQGHQARAKLNTETDNAAAPIARRNQREKRNELMTALTASEASVAGLDRQIVSFKIDTFLPLTCGQYPIDTVFNRVNHNARAHHFSEFTVVKPDGAQYKYTIPAYNTKQREVSFNVDGAGGNCATGLVRYADKDNTKDNPRGTDHYFNATEMGPYAHSYLLTAVLSADYVDVTGDGISDDDLGTAIRINYSRALPAYRWRVPVDSNMASYSRGLESDRLDDKGSYIYGEKEIWYVHSIVTKTHVAEFSLSKRSDALGVTSETGTVSPEARLYRLDSITLYAKQDRALNGANAVPIKRVHFTYDNHLCPGIPNAIGGVGKLTLTGLYFTYGNQLKGKLHPYAFHYGTINPSYNLRGYDRWGNYKPNPPAVCGQIGSAGSPLSNAEDPYVVQNRTLENGYASAWQMDGIDLPSGGSIHVDYEADDYAFVQDRPAMQMFKVVGAGAPGSPPSPPTRELYSRQFSATPNTVLYFVPTTPVTSKPNVLRDYLSGIDTLYFRFLIDITGAGDYEFVPGYAKVKDYGVQGTGTAALCWVQLEPTGTKDGGGGSEMQPIAKAGIQFARLNMSKKIYPGSDPNGSGESALMAVAAFATDIQTMVTGFNTTLMSKGFANGFVPEKSWIRLRCPARAKLGGGCRVKRIALSDAWDEMTDGTSAKATYGQEYDYRMEVPGTHDTISSGVASYEPMIGNEENPFRMPVGYSTEHFLAPDDEHYLETPLGESLFPDPGVGYRRVTVRDLPHTGVHRTATGRSVHEFYTAYDFPVRTAQTDMEKTRTKPNLLLQLLKLGSLDQFTASQGYVVEMNNMHGVPKAEWAYAEGNPTPISGTEYVYKTVSGDPRQLDNNVTVIDRNGKAATKTVGLDIDAVLDMRETESSSDGTDYSGNFDLFMAGIFPIPIPMLWISTSHESTRFRSAVMSKAVYRYGILQKIVAHDLGASVETENVALDGETGEVLLTKTANTFHDPVYNFTYPAHWGYDGMGPAYRNVGATIHNVSITTAGHPNATVPNASKYFVRGDEVLIGGTTMAWVLGVSGNGVMLVDRAGRPIVGTGGAVDVKIVRSGRRNEQSLPIGAVRTLQNPITSTGTLKFEKVLDANAVQYYDWWSAQCGKVGKMQRDSVRVCDSTECEQAILDTVLTRIVHTQQLPPPALRARLALREWGVDSSCIARWWGHDRELYFEWVATWDNQWEAPALVLRLFDQASGGKLQCEMKIIAPPEAFSWSSVARFVDARPRAGQASGRPQSYTMTALLSTGKTYNVTVVNNCFEVSGCRWVVHESGLICGTDAGDAINPFVAGLWGNWRQVRSWLFLSDRNPASALSTMNIRYDGIYKNFSSFWNPPSAPDVAWVSHAAGWTWTSEVTRYSPYGVEVENRDALNRYSAALYGYHNTLPTAVASNARYRQIAYDGFEDYNDVACGTCMLATHWGFLGVVLPWQLDGTTAHTGMTSLLLIPGGTATVARRLGYPCPNGYAVINDLFDPNPLRFDTTLVFHNREMETGTRSVTEKSTKKGAAVMSVGPASGNGVPRGGVSLPVFGLRDPRAAVYLRPYVMNECDCLGLFAPDTGNYVIGGWVRESLTPPKFDNGAAGVRVEFYHGNTLLPGALAVKPSGTIVEGWRRFEGRFSVPPTATEIRVTLVNPGTTVAWFDDVRIHPFASTMKTYAYNPITYRLMAVLDEQNYATLYEYDEEGKLIRLKKESERGIITVQESRSGLKMPQ